MWQAVLSDAATPELMADVYGVIGEETERITEYYGG